MAYAGEVDVVDRPLRGEPLPLDLVDTLWAGPAGPVDLFDRPGALPAWLAEHELPGRTRGVLGPLREARAALRAVVEDPRDGAALDAVLARGRVRRRWVDGAAYEEVEVAPEWAAAWTVAAAWLELPHDRVRRCAGSTCVLVFLDASRNGGRRWCSMATCGSRAKAADYYRRQRAAG
jgi:predicted RNA-binding Zn ribbon-like protein